MKLIDKQLLDDVSRQAQKSDRLRKNYNFHQSLDDKCHRFLNAVEPGTKVEIHRHPTKDESFVLLRGRVRVNSMVWIFPKVCGIMWNAWSLEVSSLNAKRGRLCRMRWKESWNCQRNEISESGLVVL